MTSNDLNVCLILLVTTTRGWSMGVERHARDIKILTKSTTNETHQIHKENLHELIITGDPLELQALISAIGNIGSNVGSNVDSNQPVYQGCFKEVQWKLLKGPMAVFKNYLTPEICQSYCKTKGMRYFGLQYSIECFCSMARPPCGIKADDNECNMKCEGNTKEMCGGSNRISLYDSRKPGTDTPNYMGCFKDNTNGRLLNGSWEEFKGSLTLEICQSYCKAKRMRYFGLQYSAECYCSVERPSFELVAGINECNMKCDGDLKESCGGISRLSVYDSRAFQPDLLGCFKEVPGRLLKGAWGEFEGSLTREICLSFCKNKGMRFFGLQYSKECYCSKERPPCEGLASDVHCNMKCEGNPGEICGGVDRLSIYESI